MLRRYRQVRSGRPPECPVAGGPMGPGMDVPAAGQRESWPAPVRRAARTAAYAGGPPNYLALARARPPSIEKVPPVTQPASSLIRNATSAAISPGSPQRPIGCVVFERSRNAS